MVTRLGGQHSHLQLLPNRGAHPRATRHNRPNQHCSTDCTGNRWQGLVGAPVSRDVRCQALNGVSSQTTNKYKGYQRIGRRFSASIGHDGRSVYLGSWNTEAEAARVHDEACIYKGKQTRNFLESEYELDQIKQFEDFAAFVQHKRQIAGTQNNTHRSPGKTSRFKGVGCSHNRWRASVNREGFHMSFGSYYTEEEAAKAYDHASIYETGHPVNLPEGTYDRADIMKHDTLKDLAEASKASARQISKSSRQSRQRVCKYIGVTGMNGRYIARYAFAGKDVGTRLGAFHSMEQAAQMYDSALILEGRAPVNFPEAEYDKEALKRHSLQNFLAFCRHLALKPAKAKQNSRSGIHSFLSSSFLSGLLSGLLQSQSPKLTTYNLPSLCYLQLHAHHQSLQPSIVVGMLRDLPNITSLKVDSGISPCMLSSQDLMHVSALSLGRAVKLNEPLERLQVLHMAYLGPPEDQKSLLEQLQLLLRHNVSLTAGYCDLGLLQSPCKRYCCAHAHLAVDHMHVDARHSSPAAMQPYKYICDRP